MPDPLPEHRESPPQWPPLAGHDEPTTPPEPAEISPLAAEAQTRATPTDFHPDAETGPRGAFPSQAGAPDEPLSGADPRLTDRLPVAAPREKTTPAPPDTHGRGVRMTIYGFGGAVVVGLIAVIVVMAGGGLVSSKESDESADKLLTDSGKVNKQEYSKLAEAVGTEDWINWRYGSTGDGGDDIPKAKQPKTSDLQIPGSEIKRPYQDGDGSAPTNPRNVQGQLGYVADNPGAKPSADHVTTVETTDTTLGYTPRAGGRFTAESEDPDLGSTKVGDCIADGGPGPLVAADRAHGKGYEAHSVLAFGSGLIATSGVSGAQKGACLKLPEGQVPTSVAVTPANEFALVTVWDTEKVRGRIAVIALGDTPGTYAASWPKTYPGLPSPGHFGFAKLLGFVELKETKAPTSIAADTDYSGGNASRVDADLSTEQGREPYAKDVAKSGFALVASSAEKKLEWIDLKPLLSGFHKAYFDGEPKTYSSPGTDAGQWPPAFESEAGFTPKVAKVDTVDSAPMAVTAIDGTAVVGDRAGNVNTYSVDGPAKAKPKGSLNLDGAVSCLTPSSDGEEVLATSRQQRSVSWVKPSKNEPSVART
ncbi:MAG: hypothetical protein ACRD0P_11110, partial [Stackebrandtia sp.]